MRKTRDGGWCHCVVSVEGGGGVMCTRAVTYSTGVLVYWCTGLLRIAALSILVNIRLTSYSLGTPCALVRPLWPSILLSLPSSLSLSLSLSLSPFLPLPLSLSLSLSPSLPQCMLWIPEIGWDEEGGVIDTKELDHGRLTLQCSLCRRARHGAAVQCAHGSCRRAFHPWCLTSGQYVD